MKRVMLIGGILLGCTAGCGTSDAPKPAESAAAVAPAGQPAAGSPQQQAANGAQQAAQGMQQLAQSLQQMGQPTNGQPVKVVEYTILKDMLPEVAGWEKSDAKGEQVSMGISISNAEARYKKGEASATLKITDSAMSQIALMPLTMMMAAGYEQKSDDGYTKSMTVAGFPGWEEWKKDSKHGEFHTVVGNRFIVEVEGDDMPSPDAARQLVQAVDLQKLSGLK